MDNMHMEMNLLIKAAKELAIERWGSQGWAGAAALIVGDGTILTSTFVSTPNETANLCHETGAICEAHKLNMKVMACACVSRERGDEEFVVLPPCGICQERLAFWGPDLEVAVPVSEDPTRWEVKRLAEVQPYYWGKVYADVRITNGWT